MLMDDLIYLRKLEVSDLDRTWVWINDPAVYLKIGTRVPVSRTAQSKWFESADASSDKLVFAVCLKEGDTHVGNVSLDSIEARHRTARLSIFIGDAAQRGRSIGSRAITALAEYAFDFLNLNRVWCKVTSGDARVAGFYERLGFKLEGVMRQHEFVSGEYADKMIFGLLRDEFRRQHHCLASASR
jgi:RimJ/RimL family protein N-acetyltransferase